ASMSRRISGDDFALQLCKVFYHCTPTFHKPVRKSTTAAVLAKRKQIGYSRTAMVNRVFGKTGWRVSQVGLGCWQFGGAIVLDGKPDGWSGITDEESTATIKRAVELGINFFDTADMYGWGHSEEVLGQTLKEIGHRDRHYIATKVGFWHDDQDRRIRNESKELILCACDAS